MRYTAPSGVTPKGIFQKGMGDGRHERTAREGLLSLITFYEALEEEMHHMMEDKVETSMSLDIGLYQHMVTVKEKYLLVLRGLSGEDAAGERLALIQFADTVKDFMSYLHNHRRH